MLVGNRNAWLPDLKQIVKGLGIGVQTPFNNASSPLARVFRRRVVTRVRSRIETVFSPFVGRQMWARDGWHLRTRLGRGMLMQTLYILFHPFEDHDPLQRAAFVTA
jgi:hypothetical protein